MLSWTEMLQIFNCGIGYIIIIPADKSEDVIDRLRALHFPAWEIGRVERRADAQEEQVQVLSLPE